MASNNFVQLQELKLAGSGCTATATSIDLQSMKYPDGTNVTMSDFGSTGYITLEPGTSKEENISFTGITQNSSGTATLTGVVRGLDFHYPYTENNDLKKSHAGGAIAIVSNNAPFYNELSSKDNDETITGTWTFTNPNIPKVDTYSAPTDDKQFATKKYVDDTATGTTNTDRIVVSGTAGATVEAGDFLYLDTSDGKWKLADASTSATSENVMLGIAQGSGTDGNTISGGVLIRGKDSNQSGLTANTIYYLSDTAGDIATSGGSTYIEVGFSISTTEFYFDPKFQTNLSKNQQNALAGTSGIPSASNKYVTDDDVAVSGTADKIVRADSSGKIDNSFLNGSLIKFSGTGEDGELNVTSGTTTLDASGSNVLIKNYTSINIASGAKLTISNPASNGTILILKCQGDVTIEGEIDLDGMGASAGNNGYSIFDDNNHYGGNGSTPTGGSAGAILSNKFIYPTADELLLYRNLIQIACGSGGGNGGDGESGAGTAGVGGSGGRGGGGLIIQCAGALDFDSGGVININGEDGSNGTDATGGRAGGGGGGGGGSAGMALVLYNSLIDNSGTINALGGNGGDGGGNTTGGNDSEVRSGGGSGAGAGSYGYEGKEGKSGPSVINTNGTNGDNATGAEGASGGSGGSGASLGNSTTGGSGGTQGASDPNHYLIAKNNFF